MSSCQRLGDGMVIKSVLRGDEALLYLECGDSNVNL